MTTKPPHDPWAAWICQRRHGGDPELLRRQLEALAPVRDKVIANAALVPGNTVLDVGCGDGLIAFGAAEAVGSTGKVIFSDISSELLDRCRELAAQRALLDRSRFLRAPASDLAGVDDQAVDAVTLRSVLIYEPDKATAFAEFHRVLRPGGRLSLFEPINRFSKPWGGYELGPATDLLARVRKIYEAIQPADTDPMRNFDERDLLAIAEQAGFEEVQLQLTIDVRQAPPLPWTTILNIAANPRLPTLAEAMSEALTPDEVESLRAHLQPLVEQGRGKKRVAVCYLSAVKS
ncbi:MAG: methyltransferase domain-containing protein [Mycobacterium sp.]|nr:methyltransferase domain-containing protein [Mycobacterium sp.]MBV9721776.1 methyltransferase domain-containing protein [Mycobacterium sp.]